MNTAINRINSIAGEQIKTNFMSAMVNCVGKNNKISSSSLYRKTFEVDPEAVSSDFEVYYKSVSKIGYMMKIFERKNKVVIDNFSKNGCKYYFIVSNKRELERYVHRKKDKLSKIKKNVGKQIKMAEESVAKRTFAKLKQNVKRLN